MSVHLRIFAEVSSYRVSYHDSLPSRLSCVRRNLPFWWDRCLTTSTEKQLIFDLPIKLVNQYTRYGVSPSNFVFDCIVLAMSDYVTRCYMPAY